MGERRFSDDELKPCAGCGKHLIECGPTFYRVALRETGA